MPSCGSQCFLCDFPIRFDSYKGCSHGCKYCFIQRNGKNKLNEISIAETSKALKDFVRGTRNLETNWADWNIPLHWGGTSDPFQPIEREFRNSYSCLKVFAESKYPFIVSTKGKLAGDLDYLELLKECNCVFQVSAVCSKYDRLEQGAPTFKERLELMYKISPNVKRLIVRIQPFMHEVLSDVTENLKKFYDAGAYGVIVEGMKFFTRKNGLVKIGADFCYPYKLIREDFLRLKDKAHAIGLAIYAGENRIRALGDSLSCCGAEGVEGFNGNKFNLNHILNGDKPEPTESQSRIGTAECFSACYQDTVNNIRLKGVSFVSEMLNYYRNKKSMIDLIFGITR